MKRIKKLLSLILVVTTIMTIASIPARAANNPPDTAEPAVVVARWSIPPSYCLELYNIMEDDVGWTPEVLMGFSAVMALMGDFSTGFASMLALMKYSMVQDALLRGYSTGKGCTMIIYDNTSPTIIVNN